MNSLIKPIEFTTSACRCRRIRPRGSPAIKFVEFVDEFQIRGRIGNRSIRIEINSSIRISFRLYEFRPSRNSYTNQRISLNSYDEFPFRLYEFRLQTISSIRISSPGDEFGSRRISYTNFVYEFSTWGRISYTNFVSKSISLANFRRGGVTF